MSFRLFLWVMGVETVLSFLVFGAVIVYVDPTVSGLPGQILFYGSLFFFVSGLFVGFLSWMRGRRSDTKALPEKLEVSFRQGIFLGMLLVVILILQHLQILVWWVGLLVGVVFLFSEMIFLVKNGKENR